MANREENIKKINAELEKLTDEQLEQVAGGGGYRRLIVRAIHEKKERERKEREEQEAKKLMETMPKYVEPIVRCNPLKLDKPIDYTSPDDLKINSSQ